MSLDEEIKDLLEEIKVDRRVKPFFFSSHFGLSQRARSSDGEGYKDDIREVYSASSSVRFLGRGVDDGRDDDDCDCCC